MQMQDAQQIASQEVELRRQTSEFWRQVTDLEVPRLTNETLDFWVFFAGSQQLIDASHAPGGMHITVDKQTGRIWTRPEIRSYYEAHTASSRQLLAA